MVLGEPTIVVNPLSKVTLRSVDGNETGISLSNAGLFPHPLRRRAPQVDRRKELVTRF